MSPKSSRFRMFASDLIADSGSPTPSISGEFDEAEEIDLLADLDPSDCWSQGEWTIQDGKLVSPKMYGSRLELPFSPKQSYRLIAVVEPLDEPNGLLLGHQIQGNRFATLSILRAVKLRRAPLRMWTGEMSAMKRRIRVGCFAKDDYPRSL